MQTASVKLNFELKGIYMYVAPDQEDRPSMLCTLGHESSKRMVWLTIPCKLLRKDKLLEHQRSLCKQT